MVIAHVDSGSEGKRKNQQDGLASSRLPCTHEIQQVVDAAPTAATGLRMWPGSVRLLIVAEMPFGDANSRSLYRAATALLLAAFVYIASIAMPAGIAFGTAIVGAP
jgi:hypothetical protein